MTPTSLYRHFAADGTLLYVGISLSWPARTKAHAHNSRWFERVARVEIEHFATREAALIAEREAIKREKPRFNIVHNREAKEAAPTDLSSKRKLTNDQLLGVITGRDAIVGPALVYGGDAVSVMVAHGTVGKKGELTEIVLGELFGELPSWAAGFCSVLTIRTPDQITMDEARSARREIFVKLHAHKRNVRHYDTDLDFANAFATIFPSRESRRIRREVASEKAAA